MSAYSDDMSRGSQDKKAVYGRRENGSRQVFRLKTVEEFRDEVCRMKTVEELTDGAEELGATPEQATAEQIVERIDERIGRINERLKRVSEENLGMKVLEEFWVKTLEELVDDAAEIPTQASIERTIERINEARGRIDEALKSSNGGAQAGQA